MTLVSSDRTHWKFLAEACLKLELQPAGDNPSAEEASAGSTLRIK